MSHFDKQKKPYHFADMFAYPSRTGGKNIETENKVSTYIRKGKKFPQIRLVVSTQHVLNPNYPLIIKRYDNLNRETIERYEEALRNFYKTRTVNEEKKGSLSSDIIFSAVIILTLCTRKWSKSSLRNSRSCMICA
jgi:hypothetical protein